MINHTTTLDPGKIKCTSKSQRVIVWMMVLPPMLHVDSLSPTTARTIAW